VERRFVFMNHELLQELKFEQEVNQTAGEILLAFLSIPKVWLKP